MDFDQTRLCVSPDSTIREAIRCIDQNGQGIGLVTNKDHRLLGTITDGDVRRAMLAGINLDAPVHNLLARKAISANMAPITAPVGTARQDLLHLMKMHTIQQIPLLDSEGKVGGLVTLQDLVPDQSLAWQGVIMAGGYGRRLRPLTDDLPKPMLPLGDSPLMQLTIEQLRDAGIKRVHIITHFMSEKIKDYFGDGGKFGVQLQYVDEKLPLGTAGFLALMTPSQDPLLVINGDILTQVDFRALLVFHREHSADLTVAVRRYELKIPYGVIESEGSLVRRIVEKPVKTFHVNGGIYVLEPVVHRYLPVNPQFDMTDLIALLINAGRRVICFPIREYWLDIGQPVDYEQAQKDVKQWRLAS